MQNYIKINIIIQYKVDICVATLTLKYFRVILKSTHDQVCIDFTVKLIVWDISLTNFLGKW